MFYKNPPPTAGLRRQSLSKVESSLGRRRASIGTDNMEWNFGGKRALVTGASGGIGREVTRRLVASGAQVVALDVDRDALGALQREFPHVETLCVDLMDWEATAEAGHSAGQLDFLVNCAAIFSSQEVGSIDQNSVDRVMGINFRAILNLSQTVSKGMKGRGGSIVNISSICSKSCMKTLMVYSCSKAAVDMATKFLALELGPHKIRVNAVNPTWVNTPMGAQVVAVLPELVKDIPKQTPLGRTAEPEDIAAVILYLLSDQSSLVSGVCLNVDGGILVN